MLHILCRSFVLFNKTIQRGFVFSLFFVIAYALPIVTTIIVVLVAGAPSGLVVNEKSAAALVVLMAMVHAPTIAAVIVVFRSQRLEGIKILFQQFRYWRFAPHWYLKAILIFPATMLAVLFALSFFSSNFSCPEYYICSNLLTSRKKLIPQTEY